MLLRAVRLDYFGGLEWWGLRSRPESVRIRSEVIALLKEEIYHPKWGQVVKEHI